MANFKELTTRDIYFTDTIAIELSANSGSFYNWEVTSNSLLDVNVVISNVRQSENTGAGTITYRCDVSFDGYNRLYNNVFSEDFTFTFKLLGYRGAERISEDVLYTIYFTLPPITILPVDDVYYVAGTAITPLQFTASGTTAPYAFTSSTLPPGLSINASGLLTGTPTTLGTFNSTIRVTDANGDWNSVTVKFIVSGANQGTPTFTVPDMSGAVGAAYGERVIAVGGTTVKKYDFTCSALPQGLVGETRYYGSDGNLADMLNLAVSSKFVISGTPTVIGTFPITLSAKTQETYPVFGSTTFDIIIAAVASTAIDDTFTLDNRAPETELTVLANDTGSGLTLVSVTTPTNGTARISGGKLYYTAKAQDDAYTDNFTYTIKDSSNVVRVADVQVSVKAKFIPEEPITYTISDGSIQVYENASFVFALPDSSEYAGNFLSALFSADLDFAYLWTIISVGTASHGVTQWTYSTTSNGRKYNNKFTYTPSTDYTGNDAVVFTVKDPSGVEHTATLDITVVEAGTLTITPVSDISLYEGDNYNGNLFTVQGGVSPFRAANLRFTTTSYSNISGEFPPNSALLLVRGRDVGSFAHYDINVKPSAVPADTSSPFFISVPQLGTNSYYPVNNLRFPDKGYYIATLTLVDGSAAPGQTATASVKFIVYGLDGSAPDPADDPGDPNNPPPAGTATIQGTLRLDTSDGVFAARKVYLYNYTTGAKVAETTSDGTTGVWSFTQVAPGEYFVVGAAQGDDLNVPRDFDALGVITVV